MNEGGTGTLAFRGISIVASGRYTGHWIMARKAFKATVGANLGEGQFVVPAGSTPDVVGLASTADTDAAAAVIAYADVVVGGTDYDAVAAAIAVLVADGASPTQAHVTTLDNAFTTFATKQAALKTAVDLVKTDTAAAAAVTGDAVLSIDTTNVSSITRLKRVIDALLRLAQGSGIGE